MNANCSQNELREYFIKLHKQIHWLLVYKEKDFPELTDYFNYVIFQLKGLRNIIQDDYRIVHLLVLIEAAKIESQKENYDHEIYRKAILDAHGIISSLEGGVFNG